MLSTLPSRHHVLVARGASAGTIAGASVGAAAAVILMLICSLPFLLKCRRKRRLRKRQDEDALRPGMAMPGTRPSSQVFPPHVNRLSHMSQSRLASATATLSDHDSQTGKEYGPDGITYHRSAAPSPALVGKTLRACSPAPSVGIAASSASLAAASRKDSPALAHGPFPPPIDKETMSRAPTFGTLTTEPEPLSRSATDSQHGSQSPTFGDAFRKFHDKVFHRDSTRSSGSDSRKTGNRSPDVDLDEVDHTQTEASISYRHDKPVMGGLAEEYYLGGPLSPPEEPPISALENSQFLHLIAMQGAALAGVAAPRTQVGSQQQNHLGSPFNPSAAPLSPTSPFLKEEDLSSEEGGKDSFEAKSDTLSPPPRGLPSSSPKRFEPPPSPSHPAPGTVNPMDMMKPTTAAEQAAWVDTELWKLENSPSPQVEKLPSPQPEPSLFQADPSPPSQPQPFSVPLDPSQQPQSQPQQQQQESPPSQPQASSATDRPQFQAVVRHPTQMDLSVGGQPVPQHEEQIITDISDASSPGPGFDQYAYGPSPSDHTSPETRLTESAYTGSPSPRSSMNSNRPISSYGGTGKLFWAPLRPLPIWLMHVAEHLGTSPGDHSRPPSQGDGSPKPTSFACEICGSKFDQVHKLKYVPSSAFSSSSPFNGLGFLVCGMLSLREYQIPHTIVMPHLS